jgi:hypothetical protein
VIRYALTCDRDHVFESWFRSSETFDDQAARGLLACPLCGSPKVEKAMMAPAVTARPKQRAQNPDPPGDAPAPAPEVKSPVAILSDRERQLREKLKELRDHLTQNADYVGPAFPDEARKMHHGEIDRRSIYGEASPEEAAALSEEGIEFHPLPYLPDDRN